MSVKQIDVHIIEDNGFYVMIRNKNTSYGVTKFTTQEKAEKQAEAFRRTAMQDLLRIYGIAKHRNIKCVMHNYQFGREQVKRINIRKLDESKGYGLYILVDRREVLIAKKKYKKDLQETLSTMMLEYTEDEIVEHTRQAVLRKLQAK